MGSMRTDEILQLLTDVAAQVILPRFRKLQTDDVDQKTPGDFVTIADREAEELITAELQARAPGCLVVGEEATFANPGLVDGLAEAELAYTVDPIDGTSNFIKGSPRFGVMVAEMRQGTLSRSWIWQPALEHAYLAERGAGLWRDGQRVQPQPATVPPRGAAIERAWRQLPDLTAQRQPTNNCAAFDYSQLFDGELDFVVYRRPKPWDHLPAALMLAEIGGLSLDVGEQPYRPGASQQVAIVAGRTAQLSRQVVGHWRAEKQG